MTSKSAEKLRLMVRAQLNVVGATSLARQFDIEIGLTKFDQTLLGGSKENELMELVTQYIEPNSPRGVDRVWERLHSALLKEAVDKGYNALVDKLNTLKRTP